MEYQWVEFEGREIRLSRLKKEIWPGITKADLISYYLEVSDLILPYLRDRPLTLTLYPNGISGKKIVLKNYPSHAPNWIERFPYYSVHEGRTINYLICSSKASLIWLANLTNLEFHITLSKRDDFNKPDLMLFDLDPFPPAGFKEAARAALIIRDGLRELGLKAYPKTSGATGLHILVGVERKYEFKEIREIVRILGSMIQSLYPEVIAEHMPVEKRRGKVFLDFAQNSLGRTITSPYSLKPVLGAVVSTPLQWRELEEMDFKPEDFNIHTIPDRVRRIGDLSLPILKEPQDLAKAITLLKN
ncbi:MAG: hypothetical protein QXJ68_06955 [Methanocellales archaeon]